MSKARFLFSFLILGIYSLCLLGRLYYIQVYCYKKFSFLKEKQYIQTVEIEPPRGSIYDRCGRELAITIDVDSVYVDAKQIEDIDSAANKIANILNLNYESLRVKLNTKRRFIWLARKIDPQKALLLKKCNLKGVNFIKEGKRFYPEDRLANQVLGYVGLDNQGLTGIERNYDQYIRGENSFWIQAKDALGRNVLNDTYQYYQPKCSHDVVLTIDKVIQYIAERELDKVCRQYKPNQATVIVQNTTTGEILALDSRPTFSRDEIRESDLANLKNRAITEIYEPGSTFKIITAAACLEEKVVNPADRIFCENGEYKIGKYGIHDHEKKGWLSFAEVIHYSSNIGMAKIAEKLRKEKLYYYSRLFGFGSLTGIQLPGEAEGILRQTDHWSGISLGRIAFGQEVGVTALQLICAVSAVANKGILMQPYIVKAIKAKSGEVVKSFYPQMVRRVISNSTATTLNEILVGVVENGTGAGAAIKGYSVAGKTGTAQKIDPNTRRYSATKYVASFIGYLPADNPQITILVIIDEPKGVYWGGSVAAPVFKGIAQDVIRYLNIPAITNVVEYKKINDKMM